MVERGEILVTGAAGFVGRSVVAELARRGWRVRAFLHVADLAFSPDMAAAAVLRGDVRELPSLRRAVEGCDAVVSLAARKLDEPDSEATNVGGARNLVAACREAGVRRVINVSTQSAKLARPGLYGRTKRAADEVFVQSGLAVTTLRPSLVYGVSGSGAFDTVRRCIERLPVVPILGNGRWISAPLHVDDVARGIADCLEQPATVGRTYDLVGPDAVSFDELVNQIARVLDRRCRKFHVPLAIALPMVRTWKAVFPRASITVSNVLGSNQDTGMDPLPARRDFGFAARPLAAGLCECLENPLEGEARRIGRYLLGETPARELCQRYARAVPLVFGGVEDGSGRFLRRQGWALPWLDAALSVFGRRLQARQRVLLMLAILETSPRHADVFLTPPPARPRLVVGLGWRGLVSLVRMAGGMLVLPLVWVWRSHGAGR